ncbi:MAG TPA: response regulator transcription factor [Streptosporangiaceae bacterium]
MTVRVVMADDQELLRAGFRVLLDATDDLELVGEASTGTEAVALTERLHPDVVLMDIRMPEMDGIEATRRICTNGHSPDREPGVERGGEPGGELSRQRGRELGGEPGGEPGGGRGGQLGGERGGAAGGGLGRQRGRELGGEPGGERGGAGAGPPWVLILTTFDLDAYVYGALRAGASGFLLKDAPPAELLAAIRVVATGEALLAPTVTRRLIAEFARRPEPSGPAGGSLGEVTGREREVLTLIARGLSNAEIAVHLHLSPATVKTHIGRLLSKLAARDRAQLVIAAYENGLVKPAR